MADRAIVKFCLDMITEVPASSRPGAMSTEAASQFSIESAEEAAESSRPWVEGDGIQGLGVGAKIKDGAPTGDLALRVYVDQKRPIAEIEHVVPSTVQVGGLEALTDVIEIGVLEPEVFSDRVRPIRPGLSIARDGDPAGTLGAFIRRRADDKIYALSNSHVLADSGLAAIGDAIVQPASTEATSTGADVIGTLADFVPFDFTPSGFPNLVDAAIAEVDVDHHNLVRVLEKAPRGVNIRPRVGMQVQKVGRTSDHTIGIITDTDFRLPMRYKTASGKKRAGFRDQVLCTRYTSRGDSGSLVLSSSGLALGLHFAGSVSASVFSRISHVLAAFDADLVTE